MHRLQISVFGAVAIVFAVQGVNQNIFFPAASPKALAAGWLLLAMVDILWVLYFTSDDDSLVLYLFNSLGTGGLTPPSRRRRTRTPSAMMQGANGYPTNYASGIGSHDNYDSKLGGGAYASPNPAGVRSQNSYGGSLNDAARSIGGNTGGAGSIHNQSIAGGAPLSGGGGGPGSIGGADNGPGSPLMAGIGAGNSTAGPGSIPEQPQSEYLYKAKALYNCASCPPFTIFA